MRIPWFGLYDPEVHPTPTDRLQRTSAVIIADGSLMLLLLQLMRKRMQLHHRRLVMFAEHGNASRLAHRHRRRTGRRALLEEPVTSTYRRAARTARRATRTHRRPRRGRRPGAALETAGEGGQPATAEVLAEEAVDDGIGGAVAVAEQLEDGEQDASDGAPHGTAIPQHIHLRQ